MEKLLWVITLRLFLAATVPMLAILKKSLKLVVAEYVFLSDKFSIKIIKIAKISCRQFFVRKNR